AGGAGGVGAALLAGLLDDGDPERDSHTPSPISSAAATVPTPAHTSGALSAARAFSASVGGGGRMAASCAAEMGGSAPAPAIPCESYPCEPCAPDPWPDPAGSTGGRPNALLDVPVGIVNVRSTLASRSAESQRCAGSFAHAFSIAAASFSGTSCRHLRRSGSGWLMCCFITSRALGPENGARPVSRKKSVHPSE